MIDPGLSKLASDGCEAQRAALCVDVIADLVCPWCFLGKRRLDEALRAVHGPSVVNWFPFQLNPAMPRDGMRFDDYLESRFGDAEAVQPGLDYLIRTGQDLNVRFRFDRIERVPNTVDAHRLMHLADIEQRDASRLAERMMRGFFESGEDLGDRDALADIARSVDLEPREVFTALEDDASRQVVLGKEAQVRKGGVTGVPDFLINKRLFVTGAQSTETLVNVFDRAMFGKESDQPASEVIH